MTRDTDAKTDLIAALPTGALSLAAIVGTPVHHSLSPFLHNAWLRDLKLNGVYGAFNPKDEHGFERLVLSCRSNGIKGLNITAPYKEQALKLSDSLSDIAIKGQSVNLMTFDDDGRVHGHSTDGYGLIRAFALQAPDCDLTAGPVTIVGAGGAARAVIASLLDFGTPEVRIVNRTVARAEELVFAFKVGVSAYALADIDQALKGSVAVINAASGGPMPLMDALDSAPAVMDMTYRPLKTNWLRVAEGRGLAVVDGLGMLIEQARPSFEAFYGVTPNPACDVRGLALTFLGEA
jgi:shikimate dehydrogenase